MKYACLLLAMLLTLSACVRGGPPPQKPQRPEPPPAPWQSFTYESAGYSLDLPPDMSVETRYAPDFVRASNARMQVTVSSERSPYEEIEMYFRDYLNRFILDPAYREANAITLREDAWTEVGGRRTRLISFSRKPAPGSPERQNDYLFAYVITGEKRFANLFFRTESLDTDRPIIDRVLRSFRTSEPRGEATYALDWQPAPGRWNEETKAAYARLNSAKSVVWGIFSPWALTRDYGKVAAIEERLGFRFPILLHYLYLGHPFPTEGMERAYTRGQLVELTMQVAAENNDNTPQHNANFDVMDGVKDEEIRAFARAAKAFGHPFLFRLNNEMNTDWAQYSGLLLLSDADLYIKVWRRIYRIFEEEGVENAIWVYNPNSSSYPPTRWNSHTAYYPGNAYVHTIGLTGYNTGDYFREVTGEHWRSFEEIYQPMVTEYRKLYSRFPWIITEFASSSVGGDKPAWIRDMFAALPRYSEIKAAVWWSYADYDYRPGKTDIPGRRYWLDETPETLRAFGEGVR